MRTEIYNLNMRVGAGIPPTVKVSQYDVARTIGFRLYEGALAYNPGANAVVKITGKKPSGLGFTVNCSMSGSVAVVSTTLEMTQESGRINAELHVTDGSVDVGTSNFVLYVEPSPHPDGTTDGTLETMDDIQTQIGDLSNLETSEKSSLVGAINEAAQSGGTEIVIDDTLTQTGQAADAKKTGDDISAIQADLSAVSFSLSVDSNGNATFIRSDLVNTEEVNY